MSTNGETVTLTDDHSTPAELPAEVLTQEELELLLAYKRFLIARQYREALYCNRCWSQNLAEGTQARVQHRGGVLEALIKCRCRVAYGKGAHL